jgi:hypothetical protein
MYLVSSLLFRGENCQILDWEPFDPPKIDYARELIKDKVLKPLSKMSLFFREIKYLSTINYTSKPLLRQTSAVISKQ